MLQFDDSVENSDKSQSEKTHQHNQDTSKKYKEIQALQVDLEVGKGTELCIVQVIRSIR